MADARGRGMLLTWAVVGVLVVAVSWALVGSARNGESTHAEAAVVTDAPEASATTADIERSRQDPEASPSNNGGGEDVSTGTDASETDEPPPPGEAGHAVVPEDIAPTVSPRDLEPLVEEPMEGAEGLAAELVAPLVSVQAEVLADPAAGQVGQVEAVASGSMLDALLAQALEYEENGWSQEGTPIVVGSEITALDLDSGPPSAELRVCLDHSGVDLVDSSGESLKDPAAPARVSTIYELVFVDDLWVVVYQTFADETDC